MSTPEERAANVAKQRRFQERHPDYEKKRFKRNPLMRRIEGGKFRTFELADPRDSERLPRIIGFCWANRGPVWEALWSVRCLSQSRWAAWLRELDSLNLKPVERLQWALGRVVGISRLLAHDLVAVRLRDINTRTTGDPVTPPPWLLRNIEAIGARDVVRTPVACLRPDGSISRYPSIADASRANKIITEVSLRHWIWTISHDPRGNLWFDDKGNHVST
jgi:hypothetical protein